MKKTTLALTALTVAAALAGTVVLAERSELRRGDRHDARMERGHHGGEHRGGMRRGRGMMQMMETFDTDGDGSLTQDEVDAARAAQLAEFDTDGDGSLSLDEYQGLWLSVMRERMVDQFQSHDDDGDGIVTAEEFGERFDGIVARADRNGDGVLNADDMRRAEGRRDGRRGGPRGDAETETPSE